MNFFTLFRCKISRIFTNVVTFLQEGNPPQILNTQGGFTLRKENKTTLSLFLLLSIGAGFALLVDRGGSDGWRRRD